MLNFLLFRKVFLIVLLVGFTLFSHSETTFAANGPDDNDEGMEVLTRGPIHEAFADVSVDETSSGPVISRPVPEPINEIPPDFRPEGNRVEWISGYWSWDEDQNDYIWVSGVWRDVPPDRQWIPGYWHSVAGGNQYISGYWTDINQTPTVYLPQPPEPLQARPSSFASAPDSVWIDGYWVWSRNGYAWQTGYWHESRPDMVWIPAHYVWTPRGYIFVLGYWDYQPDHRGVMFAPLYYPQPIYRHHRYFYRPHIVLDTGAVFLSLFIRQDSHHYYFGDYYDHRYEKRGFRPWYSKHATRYGYDPLYRNYRQQRMLVDRQWENNYHQQVKYRRDHRDARPPQRLTPTREHQNKQPHNQASQRIGRLFGDVLENKAQTDQFIRIKPDQKQKLQTQSRKNTNFQAERRKSERAPHAPKQARQPASLQKSEKTSPVAAPGRSKDERKEYADQQNLQQGAQGRQQQPQGEEQGQRGRSWQRRPEQPDHGK